MLKTILVLILVPCSVFAFNDIKLKLPDFRQSAQEIKMLFDIELPKGQKLNLGAKSNLKIEESLGDNIWSTLSQINLNQSVNFLGDAERVTVKSKLSEKAKKVRVTGTLYHCPKKGVKGPKSYCVIQPIKGEASASKSGALTIVSKIKGAMIN